MKDSYLKKVNELESILHSKIDITRLGLFSGLSGITYIKHVLNHFDAIDFTNTVYDRIADSAIDNTFYAGLSGVSWMIQSLKSKSLLDLDESTFTELDHILKEWMTDEMIKGNYEFMLGALGPAFYFLKRTGSSGKAIKTCSDFAQQLISQSEQNSSGHIYWINEVKSENEEFLEVNLGISHGVPAILVYLSKLYQKGIMASKLYSYIEGLTEFILTCENKNISGGYYPYLLRFEKRLHSEVSRLGWCYGDLSICLALWHANQVLKSPNLSSYIQKVLKHNATRRNLTETRVRDAGFCHGSAGIAHIFKRFFQRYQDELFLETSEYWYDQTIKMAFHKDGLAGYQVHSKFKKTDTLRKDYGMLTGISGIYACLKFAIDDSEPSWDEMFLVS